MKKLLSLFVLCLSVFNIVGCGTSGSIKDVTTTDNQVVKNDVENVVIVEEPLDDVIEPKEFDPDTYEDPEIDALLGLLDGLVEG